MFPNISYFQDIAELRAYEHRCMNCGKELDIPNIDDVFQICTNCHKVNVLKKEGKLVI